MIKIYKYNIEVQPYFEIEMPKDAKILSVQLQNGIPVFWAEVDTNNEPETRNFSVIGTGHIMEARSQQFLGTFQLQGGAFIGHLFENF